MIVRLVRGSCDDGKTCPALHLTDRGTVVVQGWAVIDPGLLARLNLPVGAAAVEVPAGLLAEALAGWPALVQTGRGTVIVPGAAVDDADTLRQMCLPADEGVVEVSADLLTEVLQAC